MMRFLLLLLLGSVTCHGALAADPPGRKHVVYFQEWSADIDGAARDVIKQAATAAKSGTKPVNVDGFANPTGSKKANILMSQLRAQRVADLLQDNGLAVDRIRLQGRGSVKFAINAQESRRVEIGTGAR